MLEEVRELSAAVSQVRELLLQIVDAISQDPQLAGPTANGAGSDGRSQREGFLATKDLKQGMETASHQETLGGACVDKLSDGTHICCGVVKRAT